MSTRNEITDVRLSPHLASPNEATLSHPNKLDGVRLSPHFMLAEFLNLRKHPTNIPSMQIVVNLTYGCHMLLEPARLLAGPIIINSGYRNPEYNKSVGGVQTSQHLLGQAADIRPRNPSQFSKAGGVPEGQPLY